ncbi:uncharacterized protein LOC130262015 isoform X1 [Oenanthe melanoleuca]|uniref:uncharacterized protein LOC130262015 isoform X1 n=1 Tax=Oenanthe melanoleuca TaxID=2939378 RepID=UPI0024C17D48|nr:uncharacterized protein LOC130262015 isoform X1 [Oenanthe melanoleuca]
MPPWRWQNVAGRSPREVTKALWSRRARPCVQGALCATGFSSSSCIMAQARCALTLIVLLLALPAQDVGAASWRAQAVALEHEATQEEEGQQKVPVPGENTRAFYTTGPEHQDGRGQSSMETSKVLHEILRELRVILGGVKSLSLNSAVSRRSTSSGSSGADPDAVESGAYPDTVLGRVDTNAVDANSFQKYCIEGIVAVLGSMLLGMVLCCVLHVWRKRRKKT